MSPIVFFASLCLLPQPAALTEAAGECPTNVLVSYAKDPGVGSEGYRISISGSSVRVTSGDAAGEFYANQTLAQLRAGRATYPCVEIRDWPTYRWRGVLIDDCRHFFGKETVKRVIDLMAAYKLNRLHWHLTEDQGWRIDVPGLPDLVKYGSVRAESPNRGAKLRDLGNFNYASESMNGEKYGPFFYTRTDLEEVVAYAKERHVVIVPEIELPGHSQGAIAAYPNLTCFPENVTNRLARSDWGISTDVLCVGNDDTLRFLEKVLDYVCEVFPSEVIHIGGDECPRVSWERCPKCRARMKAEGLGKPGDLQAWITGKMAAYLAKKGRRIMGWDEILAGDVPKSAVGQSWRTQANNGAKTELVSGAVGAKRGFDMVISPHTECYYNYRAGLEDDPFQYAGLPISLERAYAFDPMKGIPEEARSHILGSEACLWSEYIWNCFDLEWKMWPRTLAMAELLWTNPQPRDFADFRRRVEIHRKRLVKMGVNCQPLSSARRDAFR